MKSGIYLTVIAMAAIALGCAHRDTARAAPPANDFEKMKDPPINAPTYFAAGQLAESQGHLAQAAEDYRKALALEPKYLDAMYRLGVVCAQTKDYRGAIETWEHYVAATNGSAAAYSNLGFCQELAGDPVAAESAYKKGIARDASSEPCRVNYGLMLARQGRADEALRQLQAAVPPAKAHYNLASVYELQGRKQDARREYQKAVDLDPRLEDAKSRLAALN